MTANANPVKTREFQNHHFDSTIWNDFKFRDDDMVIATYAKSGTTWTQQIIAQLLFNGEEGLPVADMSPWLDLRVPPKDIKLPLVEAQTHRRFLKTHLPVDALVFCDKAKYIYIGRDGRDVLWSMYNHHATANATWYEALNDTPGRVGPSIDPPPESITQYYHDWLDHDGHPWWPFWDPRYTLSWKINTMNELAERAIQCPYCGECIDVFLDCSVEQQDYIEDCQVCCRPIEFSVTVDFDGLAHVVVSHENG